MLFVAAMAANMLAHDLWRQHRTSIRGMEDAAITSGDG